MKIFTTKLMEATMSKQTSVELLIQEIEKDQMVKAKSLNEWLEIFEQAKQMEKEQIIEAHGIKESHGSEGSRNLWQQTTGEQYYKEQYEREDNKH